MCTLKAETKNGAGYRHHQPSFRERSASHAEKSSDFSPMGSGKFSGVTMELRAFRTSASVPGIIRTLFFTLLDAWKNENWGKEEEAHGVVGRVG